MSESKRKVVLGPQDAGRILAPEAAMEEEFIGATLRPRSFDEYVGQLAVVENLKIAIDAARRRDEPLEHVLFYGPPGLGKTTLAALIARDMGKALRPTSGPTLDKPKDLVGILTSLQAGDVLFIDEIHRLGGVVEEFLYPAMEDFRVDIVMDSGAYAKTYKIPVERFTLVGATTRAGMLSAPLRERFGLTYHLDYYSDEELERIVVRSAGVLGIPIDAPGAATIARRSRGTPRVANRLLRRVRDFAEVLGTGLVDMKAVTLACERLEIDVAGFDPMDRRLLQVIITDYDGGPVGVETLAAAVGEPRDTIEDVYEPFLLQQGFLGRTPRGRIATRKAYEHLGLVYRPRIAEEAGSGGQGDLF